MKVKELVEWLQQQPQDWEVKIVEKDNAEYQRNGVCKWYEIQVHARTVTPKSIKVV
jgi:hypothetical protein